MGRQTFHKSNKNLIDYTITNMDYIYEERLSLIRTQTLELLGAGSNRSAILLRSPIHIYVTIFQYVIIQLAV